MELHLCAASGYGRVGFSTQCVPVTGVSGFVPVRRYLWYICWCWVRCKDKLPYNGSLGLLWLTLAKSWHTCMHRQRGEPKPPSGGSAGAELPVCNKAKPRLKQNKNRMTNKKEVLIFIVWFDQRNPRVSRVPKPPQVWKCEKLSLSQRLNLESNQLWIFIFWRLVLLFGL